MKSNLEKKPMSKYEMSKKKSKKKKLDPNTCQLMKPVQKPFDQKHQIKKNHEGQFLKNQILKNEIKKINNTTRFQRKK